MVAFTVQLRIFSLEGSNYILKTCMIAFLGRGELVSCTAMLAAWCMGSQRANATSTGRLASGYASRTLPASLWAWNVSTIPSGLCWYRCKAARLLLLQVCMRSCRLHCEANYSIVRLICYKSVLLVGHCEVYYSTVRLCCKKEELLIGHLRCTAVLWGLNCYK